MCSSISGTNVIFGCSKCHQLLFQHFSRLTYLWVTEAMFILIKNKTHVRSSSCSTFTVSEVRSLSEDSSSTIDITWAGSQEAIIIPSWSFADWYPMFTTRRGTSPPAGFITNLAKATWPSHKGDSRFSMRPSVKWACPCTTPGITISLYGGTMTVSAMAIRKQEDKCCMVLHIWILSSTTSVPSVTFKIQSCAPMKSRPTTAGASIAATIKSCWIGTLSVPNFNKSFTDPWC